MMKVTLKDGSVKEYAQPVSVLDVGKDLSEALARMACAGEADGECVDLRTVLDRDCSLNILTARDESAWAALQPYRQPCDGAGHKTALSVGKACHRPVDRGWFLLRY